MPGRRLEGAQSVERWQSGGHFPDDLDMSLCHVKRHKVSFVEGFDSTDITSKGLGLGDEMSTCMHESMINHHGSGFLADLRETLHVWRERHDQRRQLAELSVRDLHDVGLSWSDAVFEAEKPFWRA